MPSVRLSVRVYYDRQLLELTILPALTSTVDEDESSFACSQTPRYFIAEVDMARSIDEVDEVLLSVCVGVDNRDGLGFDGDAPLALHFELVEELRERCCWKSIRHLRPSTINLSVSSPADSNIAAWPT
jgi:hypothetical protein